MTWFWGALANLGSTVTQWLIHASVPAWLAVASAVLLFALGKWGLPTGEEPQTRVVRDTVERQITKRDTVTETRPVQVTVYDTVRTKDIDTLYAPIPTGFDFRGITPQQPVRVEGQEMTLTEWLPGEQRFVQSTYEAEQEHWAISTEGAVSVGQEFGTGAQSIGSNLNVGPSYTKDRWSVRGAVGLATTVTEDHLGMGAVAEVSITRTVLRW